TRAGWSTTRFPCTERKDLIRFRKTTGPAPKGAGPCFDAGMRPGTPAQPTPSLGVAPASRRTALDRPLARRLTSCMNPWSSGRPPGRRLSAAGSNPPACVSAEATGEHPSVPHGTPALAARIAARVVARGVRVPVLPLPGDIALGQLDAVVTGRRHGEA